MDWSVMQGQASGPALQDDGYYGCYASCPPPINPFYRVDLGWFAADTVETNTLSARIPAAPDSMCFIQAPNQCQYILEHHKSTGFTQYLSYYHYTSAPGLFIWRREDSAEPPILIVADSDRIRDAREKERYPTHPSYECMLPDPFPGPNSVQEVSDYTEPENLRESTTGTWGNPQPDPSHLTIRNITNHGDHTTADIFFNSWADTLSSSTTWSHDAHGNPVYVSDDIIVPSGVTLTVQSGTHVSLNGNCIRSTGGTIIDNGAIWEPHITLKNEDGDLMGQYSTIQSAIDYAQSHDDVLLGAGTYNERPVMKSWTNLRAAGTRPVTIQDGVVVYQDIGVIIEGIKFKKCVEIIDSYMVRLDSVEVEGTHNGLYIEECCQSPEVNNGDFHDCYRGIYMYRSSPQVQSSHIHDNAYWGVYSYSQFETYLESCNYFHDNGVYDIYANGMYDIYARGNWWGNNIPYVGWIGPMTIWTSPILYTGNPWAKLAGAPEGPSDPARAWHLSGKQRLEAGDLAGALEDYQELLDAYPHSKLASLALEQVLAAYALLELPEDGIAYLEQVAQEHPVWEIRAQAFYSTARLLTGSGDYAGALDRCDDFLAKFSGSVLCPTALLRIGGIYLYGLRDQEKAMEVYAKVAAQYPESEEARLALARLAVEQPPAPEMPEDDMMAQLSVCPNPSNPISAIRFVVPEAGQAKLAIFNLLGQQVAVLAEGLSEGGTHSVLWDGRDDRGNALASGLYFARLEAADLSMTRRLILLK